MTAFVAAFALFIGMGSIKNRIQETLLCRIRKSKESTIALGKSVQEGTEMDAKIMLRINQVVKAVFVLVFVMWARVPVASAATALTCGSLITGSISASGEVDQYAYAATSGQVITLTLSGFNSGYPNHAVPTLTLYDPTATSVLNFNANGLNQVTLAKTGTYTIQINATDYTDLGWYNLSLNCTNPLQPVTALSCGSLETGNIAAASQVDQYSYAGQAGAVITLTLSGFNSGYPNHAVPTATVYDPTGANVLNFNANSQQQFTLATSGTYVIQIYSTDLVDTGWYNLDLDCRSPLAPYNSLSCGALVASKLADAAQVDQYAYMAEAGTSITLTLSGFNSGYPNHAVPTLTLYDPSGNTVTSFGANGSQEVTLNSSGTYLIQLYSSDLVDTGTYNLGVSCISATGLAFVPITPCRIADTRNANGTFGGPQLARDSTRSFPVLNSKCSIPSNAIAYSVNATVVPNASLGYLTMWPSGSPQVVVSTLNSDGRIKANAAIIPAGSDSGGSVNVYVTDPTQFVLDIDGYFVSQSANPMALQFYPLTPCRIADTRKPNGLLGGPYISGGTSRSFPVASACNIPANATAYSLNFTAVPHGSLGYITAWPQGDPQPLASVLNAPTGTVVANAAIIPAGLPNGGVSVYASNDTDLVIDIDGYFALPATGGLSLYAVTPCRALDTRETSGAFSGKLAVSAIGGSCNLAAGAEAYAFNASVVPSGSLTYLTLWPDGQSQPLVSTLNAVDGVTTSNMAIVPSTNGQIDAFATHTTQLILDISGYFAP